MRTIRRMFGLIRLMVITIIVITIITNITTTIIIIFIQAMVGIIIIAIVKPSSREINHVGIDVNRVDGEIWMVVLKEAYQLTTTNAQTQDTFLM